MALLYNTDTAVEQNNKITSKEEYSYNLMPFSHSVIADETFVVTQDFILTGIYFRASSGQTGVGIDTDEWMDVTIKGMLIRGCKAAAIVDTSDSQSSFCHIPNWLVQRGDIIEFEIQGNGGTAGATLVGYLL